MVLLLGVAICDYEYVHLARVFDPRRYRFQLQFNHCMCL